MAIKPENHTFLRTHLSENLAKVFTRNNIGAHRREHCDWRVSWALAAGTPCPPRSAPDPAPLRSAPVLVSGTGDCGSARMRRRWDADWDRHPSSLQGTRTDGTKAVSARPSAPAISVRPALCPPDQRLARRYQRPSQRPSGCSEC